eukprot:tig00020685_g12927.t1
MASDFEAAVKEEPTDAESPPQLAAPASESGDDVAAQTDAPRPKQSRWTDKERDELLQYALAEAGDGEPSSWPAFWQAAEARYLRHTYAPHFRALNDAQFSQYRQHEYLQKLKDRNVLTIQYGGGKPGAPPRRSVKAPSQPNKGASPAKPRQSVSSVAAKRPRPAEELNEDDGASEDSESDESLDVDAGIPPARAPPAQRLVTHLPADAAFPLPNAGPLFSVGHAPHAHRPAVRPIAPKLPGPAPSASGGNHAQRPSHPSGSGSSGHARKCALPRPLPAAPAGPEACGRVAAPAAPVPVQAPSQIVHVVSNPPCLPIPMALPQAAQLPAPLPAPLPPSAPVAVNVGWIEHLPEPENLVPGRPAAEQVLGRKRKKLLVQAGLPEMLRYAAASLGFQGQPHAFVARSDLAEVDMALIASGSPAAQELYLVSSAQLDIIERYPVN